MSNRLRNYVLTLLLNKDTYGIDQEKYQKVISALAADNHTDDICSYIFRSLEDQYLTRGITPRDENIVALLTTSYCVDRAYEYLMFLQNDHEYSHEWEQEFLAR